MLRGHKYETPALLLAVFIAGGMAGAALEHRFNDQDQRRGGARGEAFLRTPGMVPPYLEALDLSETQRADIKRILENARPESDALLQETMPRLREIARETREAINEILTEAQRAQVAEMTERRRRRPSGGDHDHDRDSRRRRPAPTNGAGSR